MSKVISCTDNVLSQLILSTIENYYHLYNAWRTYETRVSTHCHTSDYSSCISTLSRDRQFISSIEQPKTQILLLLPYSKWAGAKTVAPEHWYASKSDSLTGNSHHGTSVIFPNNDSPTLHFANPTVSRRISHNALMLKCKYTCIHCLQ